jgi:hypothetical protein
VEFLNIFGALGQRRSLVVLGALLALLLGALAAGLLPFGAGSAERRSFGSAQIRVLIDHRKSVVADLGTPSETISTQAALLADLMTGDAERVQIARRAGVPAADVSMDRMQLERLIALGQLPERTGPVAAVVPRPYVVNVSAASPLPVITVDVSAPTAAAAARVALSARATLEALVTARAPSPGRSVVVLPVGPVRFATVPAPQRSPLVGVGLAVFVFLFWCCAVVVLHGVLRAWRRATVAPAAGRAL